MLQSGHWEGGPCTSATMAHASVSWACGRHPSTFNQYIEYGPVAVVANDGDTNNEGRSATDNDVEIGDGRLRILPWYGKHTALFAIHHPTRRVHLSSSSHTHPVTMYNSHSLHLQMYSESLTRSQGNMQTERMLHLDSSRTAATRGCNSSGNGWLRESVAAARDGCDIGILLGLQQRVAATQAFST